MRQDKDCLFCKMAQGAIPVPKVFEDDRFFCIKDIRPQAQSHFLVIPKEHIVHLGAAFSDGPGSRSASLDGLLETATRVAQENGLLPDGFRCVINTEKNAGQTVFHLHVHVLGGEPLKGSFGS